ncbi:AraC family transcriptional regulator [Paenibacillus sp. HB172176]|uniref:AraC family transcriptional regulator n=1 Tax=Paenibacillus sp. HB172176 TaxID=2493690 RepID=UPI0014389309|nr:AraC family transcriptional regulator [Paenibacillus sp. HB172176]
MKKNWFRRLLLSYLPVLVVIVTLFAFVGIVQFNALARKEAETSTRIYVQNLQNTLELSLRSIESMMLETIARNPTLTSFVAMDSDPEFIIELSQLLQSMVNTHPWIRSAYIYRAGDDVIVSNETKLTLATFGDRDYIEEHLSDTSRHAWSSPRIYRTLPNSEGEGAVISMTKGVPINMYGQALLVVNVGLSDVQQVLRQYGLSDVNQIRVTDGDNHVLFGQNDASAVEEGFRLQSDYTGWVYHGGLKPGRASTMLSYVASPYFIGGFLALAAAIGWVIYITRKNYRPIETMMSRIKLYNESRMDGGAIEPPHDELQYIDQTLSSIMEASQTYESRNKENSEYRRLMLLQELISGDGPPDIGNWKSELEEVGLAEGYSSVCVSVFEIDKYVEFISQYSRKDQGLFKYVLKKVVDETAKSKDFRVWQEWIDNHRLCVMAIDQPEKPLPQSELLAAYDEIRIWLERHVRLTVTAGVGPAVTPIGELANSYDIAQRTLDYKSTLGGNRIISHSEIGLLQPDDLYVNLQYVPTIAQSFRFGNDSWQEQLELLFAGLKKLLLPKEEINGILTYMNYYFHLEMKELPPDYEEIWKDEFRLLVDEQSDSMETLDELADFYVDTLSRCAARLQEHKAQKGNQGSIQRMRQYIEEHYSNPDLSLSLLSDMLELSPASLSTMFKEEFGEKFVVYLSKVRMEHAKDLLRQTSLPIQDISERCGYQHQMSFIRAFKKTVGTTPGEYRKTYV